MATFTWTSVGNYPAGGFAWSAQPLAAAPAQTYFTPSPAGNPLKINAENWNYILGTIATNLADQQAETGAYKLAALNTFPLRDDTLNHTTWTVACPGTFTWTAASAPVATVSNLLVGDVLEIDFTGTWFSFGFAAQFSGAALGLAAYNVGVTPPSPTRIGGSGQFFPGSETALNLKATKTATATKADIYLFAEQNSGSPLIIFIDTESLLVVKVWRPTGVPQ